MSMDGHQHGCPLMTATPSKSRNRLRLVRPRVLLNDTADKRCTATIYIYISVYNSISFTLVLVLLQCPHRFSTLRFVVIYVKYYYYYLLGCTPTNQSRVCFKALKENPRRGREFYPDMLGILAPLSLTLSCLYCALPSQAPWLTFTYMFIGFLHFFMFLGSFMWPEDFCGEKGRKIKNLNWWYYYY